MWDLSSVSEIDCIGITHGIIGLVQLAGVYEPHLLIIKESVPVGVVHAPDLVYKIKSICILGQEDPDTCLIACSKHSTNAPQTSPPSKSKIFDSQLMNKTWGVMKSAGTSINPVKIKASKTTAKESLKNIEKRINEELHKIFDDTDSFYFCLDGDVTNNLQRKNESLFDDRFFWNFHMLKDIITLEVGSVQLREVKRIR